jgi:hypothetical protein
VFNAFITYIYRRFSLNAIWQALHLSFRRDVVRHLVDRNQYVLSNHLLSVSYWDSTPTQMLQRSHSHMYPVTSMITLLCTLTIQLKPTDLNLLCQSNQPVGWSTDAHRNIIFYGAPVLAPTQSSSCISHFIHSFIGSNPTWIFNLITTFIICLIYNFSIFVWMAI